MKVEHTSRSVIENKLLVALMNDDSKIAILATKQDLDMFIAAFILAAHDRMRPPGLLEMLEDLQKLKKAAFNE